MTKRLVICEINDNYLKNVKEQMRKQNMPMPKDDNNITIAHKPLVSLNTEELCNCNVCKKISENLV